MAPLSNLTLINSTSIDIQIEPALYRNLDETFDPESVSFQWEVAQFEGGQLDIQLNFSHPEEISPLSKQDKLFVKFNSSHAPNLFYSDELQKPLDPSSYLISSKITKQVTDPELSAKVMDGGQNARKGLTALLVVTFLINQVMSGAMKFIIPFINSLQMTIHLPIMNVIVPGNVNGFFSYLQPIVTFDVFDSDYTTELVLNFDEEYH